MHWTFLCHVFGLYKYLYTVIYEVIYKCVLGVNWTRVNRLSEEPEIFWGRRPFSKEALQAIQYSMARAP